MNISQRQIDKREPSGSLFRLVLSLITLHLLTFSSFAQRFDMNARCREAYALIYDLQIQKAEELIRAERTANPHNYMVLLLEDQVDFLVNVLTESADEYKRREPAFDKRLDQLESYTGRSPWHLLCMAEMNLHWAVVGIRQGEYLSGASRIRAAFKLLEANQKAYPDFKPNLKGLGLLHTLVGTVPNQYQWAVKVMGMSGTVEKGMAELKQVMALTRTDPQMAFMEVETVFLYTLLHLNLLNDPGQLTEMEKHIKTGRTDSQLIDFALANIYRKQKRNDDAIALLEKGMTRPNRYPFPYLRFLLGELKLYRFDADADNWLRLYLNTFRGKSYLRSAQQKRAWLALAVNAQPDKYLEHLGRVSALPASLHDEDAQALREAEKKAVPHLGLLRARIRFDGGYLNESLDELDKIDATKLNPDQKLEFTYRKARVNQDLNHINEAISLYLKATETGKNSKTYFAANAALQLGLIYEQKGDKEKARNYFQQCTTYPNTEYRNSIEQKAKAGLSRLAN